MVSTWVLYFTHHTTIEVLNICLFYLYVLSFIIIMYLSKHDWKNTAWSHSLHYDLSPLFTNIVQLRITVFIVPSVRFVIPYSHTIFSPPIIIIWSTSRPVCEAKTRLSNTVPFPVSRMFISCGPPVFACCARGKKMNYPYSDYFLLLYSVIILYVVGLVNKPNILYRFENIIKYW